MRMTLAMLLISGFAVYTVMGDREPASTTHETDRAGARVLHVTPQVPEEVPTREARIACNAVLSAIDLLQRKPARGQSDLAQLQANRRAEAEWRDDIRKYDKSPGVEARMDAAIRQNRPDGQWTNDRAWLRRDEAVNDPISRLRNNDFCADCAESDGFLNRLENGVKTRCGLS